MPFVVLALETGARFNTVRTLQWRRVDFGGRCLKWGKDKRPSGIAPRDAIGKSVEMAAAFENVTCQSPTVYVVSKNPHRRHLSFEQRTAIGVNMLPSLEQEAAKRKLANLKNQLVGSKSTGEDIEGRSGESRQRGAACLTPRAWHPFFLNQGNSSFQFAANTGPTTFPDCRFNRKGISKKLLSENCLT